MKYSGLIAALVSGAILILQQYLGEGITDLKVVGFALLIGGIGTASIWLKGKGTTIAGILGTVGYTFYDLWTGGTFTVEQFVLTSALAILTLIAPSVIPQTTTNEG